MMIIDFTPQLYLFEWGLVALLTIAAGGILACLDREERKPIRAWVETPNFVRTALAAVRRRTSALELSKTA